MWPNLDKFVFWATFQGFWGSPIKRCLVKVVMSRLGLATYVSKIANKTDPSITLKEGPILIKPF